MSQTYRQTQTAAPCGTTQSCASHAVGTLPKSSLCSIAGTAGTSAITITVAAASSQSVIMFEATPGAGAIWTGNSWSVRVNVTTANSNLNWRRLYICRLNSSCLGSSTIASNTGLSLSFSTTGVKTATTPLGFTQTASAGDKWYAICVVQNSNTMTAQSAAFTPGELIDSAIIERRVMAVA